MNKDGTLYTMAYGNACSINLDPIEKKPLFHFLPGTNVFSFAISGCGFRCLNNKASFNKSSGFISV